MFIFGCECGGGGGGWWLNILIVSVNIFDQNIFNRGWWIYLIMCVYLRVRVWGMGWGEGWWGHLLPSVDFMSLDEGEINRTRKLVSSCALKL